MMYRLWMEGMDTKYAPTMADVFALSKRMGSRESVVMHNYPVAMTVRRVR